MAQDFYQQAKVLHEEFQKRELHFLSLDRQMNNVMCFKRDHNLSFQEYLQKIKKREKHFEETYRNIMKQMEEMNYQTDLMASKLDKLGVLKRNFITLAAPNFSSLHTNTLNQHLYEISNSSPKPENCIITQLAKPNTTSVSTQTENIFYCVKCNAKENFGNLYQSLNAAQISDLQYESSNASKTAFSSESRASLPNFLPGKEMPSQASASMPVSHSITEETDEQCQHKDFNSLHEISSGIKNSESWKSYDEKCALTCENAGESNEIGSVVSEVIETENVEKSLINRSTALRVGKENMNQKYDFLENSNVKSNKVKKCEKSSNKNSKINFSDDIENIGSEVEAIENEEKSLDHCDSVLKSDEESMNHEFDFLETSNIKEKKVKGKETILLKNSEAEKQMQLKETNKSTLLKNTMLDTVNSDNKSDASFSITAPESPYPHSSNVSIISDSDSFSGKETPQKESAAYQALLGNVNINDKKSKQIDSDSDSLNEVENVLANAVRKKSIGIAKPSVTKEDKSVHQQEDTNISKKSAKLPGNKTQLKLSKSTRKVLGLDTSSGSEAELATKLPEKQTEEDSDEFDFYD